MSYDIISTYLAKELSDCSDTAIVNLIIANDQRQRLAFYHTPPPRYNPISPYPENTKQQLDMRRKAEILKYDNNQQNTKTNNLTKKETWARLSRGISNQPTSFSSLLTNRSTVCNSNETKITSSTASDVPGTPMNLYYDPTVPLYHFLNSSINNASYSNLPDGDTSELKLYTQDEITFLYDSAAMYVSDDSYDVFVQNQSIQTRSSFVGSIVTTTYMPKSIHVFSFSIPVGIWMMGSIRKGIIDTTICPDNTTADWDKDPSYNPHIDSIYGNMDYLNQCYSQLPGIFTPENTMNIHMLSANEMSNIGAPVSVNITYSGIPVIPLVTPTIYTSFTTPIPGKQNIQFPDISFSPFNMDSGQFYGIQYIGNIIIDNLQLDVQPEQVFDVAISMNYSYDHVLASQFDYLKTGVFFNISQENQNVCDGFTFSSVVPNFVQSSFLNYVRGSVVSTTTPTITNATIGQVGLNFVTIDNITGNYDTFILYRSDSSNNALDISISEKHIFGGLTGNSYTDHNLYPNMKYTYSIQSVYNLLHGSIIPLGTIFTQDIRINALLDQTSITTKSVSIINIVGTFTKYTIFRNDTSFSELTNNSFIDTGLLPGMNYIYSIQPFFSNQPGAIIYLGTITTLNPVIMNAYYRLLTNTSILIDISGYFSSLTIIRNGYPSKIFYITSITESTFYQFTDTNINTSTSIYPNGFVLGQNYDYSIIPNLFNHGVSIRGNTYQLSTITVPMFPLSVIINTNKIQISNILVLIPLENYQDFYYVAVARQINDTFIGSESLQAPVKNTINSPLYTDPSSTFNAISYYTYSFIPYNNIDVPGTVYTTPKLSPYARFFITNTYISSIGVSFDFINTSVLQKNNFDYVTVQKILKNSSNYYVYPIQTIYNGTNTYYDTFTTSENPLSYSQLSFTYTFRAYNVLNAQGDVRVSDQISPYASVIFNEFGIDCSTQITFTIMNQPTFSYFSIEPFYSDNNRYVLDNYHKIDDYYYNSRYDASFITISYSILPNIFLPINSYYFKISPYNASAHIKDEFIITTPLISPPASIKFLNYNDGSTFYNYGSSQEKYTTVRLNLTDTNDYIDVNGVQQPSYSYYEFAEISGGIMGILDSPTYRYSDLSTYTSRPDLFAFIAYQYAIVPYNCIDVSGMYITTPFYSPKSSITIGAISYSETDISMSFLPSSIFSYIIITRYANNIFDTSYSCMRNTFLFIDPTTQFYGGYAYSYVVQSYNAIHISGDSFTTYPPYSPSANINSEYVVTMSSTDISFLFSLSNAQHFYSLNALVSTNGQTPTNLSLNRANSDSVYVSNQFFYGDCSYVFQLTPKNANGIPNPSATITTVVYSPPATITIGTVYINNTDISFAIIRGSNGGASYYIYVSIWTAGIPGPYEPVPIGTTVFQIDPPYTADTSYSVSIIPYNALDVSNSSAILYSNPISPAALVNIGPVFTSTSDISFAFTNVSSQLYYYVYVTRKVGNKVLPSMMVPTGTTIFQDPSSMFYADTSYVYSVIPYNILDISNTSAIVKTIPTSPPAVVTVGIPSVSYTDISFAFIGLNERPFYYVYVTRIVRGIYKNSVRIPFRTSIYIDPSNVFTADTSYSYLVIPYNALDVSNNDAAITTIPVSPQAKVQIGYITIDKTSVTFPIIYANTYSYVAVARFVNGIMLDSYTVQPMKITIYTDPSNVFYANTNYSYSILPFNAVNDAGISTNSVTVSPPIVTPPNVQYTEIDISNITFSYSDIRNFYYVSITRYMNSKKIDTHIQGPGISTYADPSNVFYPDSSYSYALLPYSTINIAATNLIYYSPAVSPSAYAQVSALSISGDYTYFTFTQNKHAFYVADVTSISGGILGTTRRVPYGTTSYLDTSNTYTADISYGYSILPYNVLVSAGLSVQTNINSPQANAYFVQYTDISYNQIQFTYAAGKNRYYYVRIRRSKNGGWLDSRDIIQPIRGTSYTDTSSVFTADSSYSYYVIPYNAMDINNNASAFYTYTVSPFPFAIIASFSSVSLQNIQFSFRTTTSFYYTFISRIVNGISQPWIRQPISSLIYSDLSEPFVAYITYQYQIIPYNVVDVSGYIIRSIMVSPPATVAFLNYNNITNNEVTINFTQSTTYYYIQVAEISGNITEAVQWTLDGGLQGTTQLIVTDLWPTIIYKYLVTPFNAVNESNTSIITAPISPMAYVTDSNFTIVSDNALEIMFNINNPPSSNLTYSSLNIALLTNGNYGSYSTITSNTHAYQITSTFYPNTVYAFSMIPYNAQNIPGNEWVSSSVSPIPSVSFVSYSDISFTSVRIHFDFTTLGSYSYVILTERINDSTWGNSMKSVIGDTSFVDLYVTASNTYSYVITPYNAVDVAGTPVLTVQTITPITRLDPSTISYGATSTEEINLLFSNPTSFQYLQISRMTYTTDGELISIGPYITTTSYVSGYTDSSGTFSFNSAYQYSIIPFNAQGVSGETIITPLIIVNDATVLFDYSNGYTVSLSSISFHLFNAILYYYVSVTPVINGITKTTITLPAGQTNYTDNNTPFYSDISYCYVIAPYNTSNVNKPSNNIITPIITVPATVLFGQYGSPSPYYCTTSSISFTYVPGSTHYYYVSISCKVNGISSMGIVQPVGATSYVDPSNNYNAYTTYGYTIVPYNCMSIANISSSITTPLISPIPTVSYSYVGLDSSSVTIQFGSIHNYMYVKIAEISGGNVGSWITFSNSINSYTDYLLTPNTSYTYQIVPYNALDQSGSTITSTSISPIPVVSISSISVDIVTNNVSFILSNANTFYDVSISRITNGTNISAYVGLLPHITTYVDLGTNLFADSSYSYQILPYNILGNVGTKVYSTTISPYATVSIGPVFVNTTCISFNIINNRSFSTVLFSKIVRGYTTSSQTLSQTGAGIYTYLDPCNNFTADCSYVYSMVPFNCLGVSNIPATLVTAPVSPTASAALFLTYVNVSSTTISWSYQTIGKCYYIAVTRIVRGTLNGASTVVQPVGSSLYTDPSNAFVADASYAYSVVPYNALGIINVAATNITIPVSPDASFVLFVNYVTLSASTISWNYQTFGRCYSFQIVRYINGIIDNNNNSFVPPLPNNVLFIDNSTNFFASNTYSYQCTPFNAVYMSNSNSITMTPNTSPPASVTLGSISVSASSVSFSLINTTTFYSVSILRRKNGQIRDISYNIRVATYVDPSNNFTADSSYSYTVTPYNAINVANTSVTTSTISPIPTVNINIVSVTPTASSFTMTNTNSFYYVVVQPLINGINSGQTTTLFTGTTTYTNPNNQYYANSTYSYSVIPYNAVNISNSSTVTTVVSPPSSISTGTICINSNDISFALLNPTSFYSVSVARIVNGNQIETLRPVPSVTTVYIDPSNAFYASMTYSYTIQSYNAMGTAGSSYTTIPVSLPATVITGPIYINSNDASFALLNPGSFYSVSVARIINGIQIEPYQPMPVGATVYIDPSNVFYNNIQYSYAVKPYNALGIAGTVFTIPYVYFGIISAISIRNKNIIDSVGLLSYYPFDYIADTTLSTYVAPYSNMIDPTGLVMYYCYDVPLILPAIMPVCTISCSTTAISVSFLNSPTLYNLSVARMVNGIPIEDYQSLPPGISTYTDPSNVFYPVNVYSYSFIPYNIAGLPSSSYTTVGISPLPTITTGPFSINYNDISFALLTSTSFYQASVQRWVNGQPIETYQPISYGTTVYVDPSNSFSTDVSYSYALLPYNVLGVVGSVYITPFVSPLPTVTVSIVSYNNNDISFAISGQYHTVSIVRLVNGTPIEPYQSVPYGTTIYIDPSNVFYPMNSYSYSIIPYSALGIAGLSYTTLPISPLPSISIGSIGNICVNGNDISFALLRSTSYYSVSIARWVNGIPIENYQSIPYGTTKYIDPSNVFYPTNSYSYSILPYNALGTAGTTFVTSSVSPFPFVNVDIPTQTYQNITVTLLGNSSFYQVAVQRLRNGIPIETFQMMSPTMTALYTDPATAFYHDISYSYAVIPYNVVGQPGNMVTSVAILYTLAIVTSTVSIQYKELIDISGFVLYYPFEPFTNTVAPSYVPTYLSFIDTSGLYMYYHFDL